MKIAFWRLLDIVCSFCRNLPCMFRKFQVLLWKVREVKILFLLFFRWGNTRLLGFRYCLVFIILFILFLVLINFCFLLNLLQLGLRFRYDYCLLLKHLFLFLVIVWNLYHLNVILGSDYMLPKFYNFIILFKNIL